MASTGDSALLERPSVEAPPLRDGGAIQRRGHLRLALATLFSVAVVTGWFAFTGDDGPRDPWDYVKTEGYYENSDGMVIHIQKVAGDSGDLNVDGGVMVKHGKDYRSTPGYADTLQVYSLAGSAGTIVGNNNFVGSGELPYAPERDAQPNGFVRFELGPLWPESEKMRLNNSGDLVVGWRPPVLEGEFAQEGRVVTGVGFTPDMVGSFVMWTGARGTADRIVRYVDAGTVVVETPRRVGGEVAQVRAPRMLLRPHDGALTIDGVELFVKDGALMFRGGDGTVTEVAPR